jgi:hypothetical protein
VVRDPTCAEAGHAARDVASRLTRGQSPRAVTSHLAHSDVRAGFRGVARGLTAASRTIRRVRGDSALESPPMPPVTPEGSRGVAPASARASGGGFTFGAYRLESHPGRLPARRDTRRSVSTLAAPAPRAGRHPTQGPLEGHPDDGRLGRDVRLREQRGADGVRSEDRARRARSPRVHPARPAQGCQFVAPVTPMAPVRNHVDVSALLAPIARGAKGWPHSRHSSAISWSEPAPHSIDSCRAILTRPASASDRDPRRSGPFVTRRVQSAHGALVP